VIICGALAVVMIPTSFVWGVRRKMMPLDALVLAGITGALLASMPLLASAATFIGSASGVGAQHVDAAADAWSADLALDPAALDGWCDRNPDRCIDPVPAGTECVPGVHYPIGTEPPAVCQAMSAPPPPTVADAPRPVSSSGVSWSAGRVAGLVVRWAMVTILAAVLVRVVWWVAAPVVQGVRGRIPFGWRSGRSSRVEPDYSTALDIQPPDSVPVSTGTETDGTTDPLFPVPSAASSQTVQVGDVSGPNVVGDAPLPGQRRTIGGRVRVVVPRPWRTGRGSAGSTTPTSRTPRPSSGGQKLSNNKEENQHE
jgi:hypothetical protein